MIRKAKHGLPDSAKDLKNGDGRRTAIFGSSIDLRQPALKHKTLAKELVALQPEVIFAIPTPAVAALQRETHEIPIVFAALADPVGSGFIASLPRPGGNITGVMQYEPTVAGKWLAMLKEIAPSLTRVAFLINPKTAPFYNYYLRAAEPLSQTLGIELVPTFVENAVEIERSIELFA